MVAPPAPLQQAKAPPHRPLCPLPRAAPPLPQSLVDMEDLFNLLKTQSTIPDGTRDLPVSAPAPEARTAEHNGTAGEDALAARRASHTLASSSSNGNGNGNGSSAAHTNGSNGAAGAASQGLRLELRGVEFGYSGKQVLRGVNIRAEPGESIAIVGGWAAEEATEHGLAGSRVAGARGPEAAWCCFCPHVHAGAGICTLRAMCVSVPPAYSVAPLSPRPAGPSGSGKSTVLRLLVRLYDAEGGQVRNAAAEAA